MYVPYQEIRLAYKSWPDVQHYLKHTDALIVPIGATEQHGPGCPLLTDTIIAEHLALELGKSSDVWVGPTISFGDSLLHLGFPGTISLKPTTLLLVVKDYISSLHKVGFRRFLIVNGHSDNSGIIFAAFSELGDKLTQLRYEVQDFWDFSGFRQVMQTHFGDPRGGHADATDASILLAIDKSLVDTKALVASQASVTYRISRDLMTQLYTQSGVINSDQRLATAEIGQELIEQALAGYRAMLQNLRG